MYAVTVASFVIILSLLLQFHFFIAPSFLSQSGVRPKPWLLTLAPRRWVWPGSAACCIALLYFSFGSKLTVTGRLQIKAIISRFLIIGCCWMQQHTCVCWPQSKFRVPASVFFFAVCKEARSTRPALGIISRLRCLGANAVRWFSCSSFRKAVRAITLGGLVHRYFIL